VIIYSYITNPDCSTGRARRIPRRQPVHRLPHQIPDQAPRRLPPSRHRQPGRARRTARRRAAVRTVLADLRELAPIRNPTQECPAGPAAWVLQGQGPPPRVPRLRRAACAGLPQMVRQDPGRPPRRPQDVAPGTLGIPDTDPARYTWEPVTPGDADHMPPAQRLLHVVADRYRWHAALTEARRRANAPPNLSATGRAA
jgi:hypothetical protein